MIGIGMFFIALTSLAVFWAWRGSLYKKRWLLWAFVFAVIPAVVANQAGWIAAEVGRQPWIVHPPVTRDAAGDLVLGADGMVRYQEHLGLRTSQAVSKAVQAEQVLGSIIGFLALYALLLALWIYLLDYKIRRGPDEEANGPETEGSVLKAATNKHYSQA
jgi:cytochrome d ubiquinol oxidase subunit I